MSDFDSIRKDIKTRNFSPIYFLHGEEPFFIDTITNDLIKKVLTEDEKAFNEHIFYGNEIDAETIVAQAKQFPMMSDYQLVVVKEAQHLSRNMDKFVSYFQNPLHSTILVFNFKYKKLDGRGSAFKALKKNATILDAKKIYADKVPFWIEQQAKSRGFTIHPKSAYLISNYIGSDLSRIDSELNKLSLVLNKGDEISPDIIERHIGISKEYNNFELTNALAYKDAKKAFSIVKYFEQNPKDNPLVVTVSVLYNFFSKVMVLHTLNDKSQAATALGINRFFLKEYQQAARSYPLKKITRIISFLREADVRSKGVGATGSVSQGEILREFVYKSLNL